MTDKELLILLLQTKGEFGLITELGVLVYEIKNADSVFIVDLLKLIGVYDNNLIVYTFLSNKSVEFAIELFGKLTDYEYRLSYSWENFDFQKFVTEDIKTLVKRTYYNS